MDITNLFSVAGKTALVTGGSRGIGLMIARGLVTNGVKVYISSRKATACQEVEEELSKIGTCVAIPADLATEEGRAQLIDAIKEREEHLDILVNNAGALWAAPLHEYPEKGYDRTIDINLKAPFFLTRDLLPLLKRKATPADPSRVINIGSIDGLRVPDVETYPYGASKAAIHHLSKMLAVKLGKENITVNAIAPGPFQSKMMAFLIENFKEQIEASCPLGRIGSPEDMVGLTIFLCARAGAYVNGATIPLDGGIHINNPGSPFG